MKTDLFDVIRNSFGMCWARLGSHTVISLIVSARRRPVALLLFCSPCSLLFPTCYRQLFERFRTLFGVKPL